MSFAVETLQHVSISLFDVRGREVDVILDEDLLTGTHTLTLDVNSLAPGVYTLRLATSSVVTTHRISVVR
jgi:endoglucanase